MIRAARVGAGVWLVVVLTGCSMVSLGYPRLPDLGVLWVQRQVSLEHAQADALKQDLSGLLAWHRQHQLRRQCARHTGRHGGLPRQVALHVRQGRRLTDYGQQAQQQHGLPPGDGRAAHTLGQQAIKRVPCCRQCLS